MWKQPIDKVNGSILAVSQFTLYARTEKGSKLDFHCSMKTEGARAIFDKIVQAFREQHGADRVATGAFGEMMVVQITNDGPTTIVLESPTSKALSP